MTWLRQYVINLRRVGPDDWPVWRKLTLEALEAAPYAQLNTCRLVSGRRHGDAMARPPFDGAF